jgi:UDP-GlcNAc:undecaprenyl-phosphate GlcNAc-1-phosphate transferase
VGDLVTFTKGVVLGSALSVVAVLLLYRFQNFSRAVFVLDGIILLLTLLGSRVAFRLIREFLPPGTTRDGLPILIYGAGDGGEMVLRELRNNPAWKYQAVGFIDDDPRKKDKVINGLQVFDANGSLFEICRQKGIAEILISSEKISAASLKRLREVCRSEDIGLKRAQMKIEPVDFE